MNARNLSGRLILLGSLLVLLAGPALAETPEFDAALQRATAATRHLVLDFFTDW